MMTERERTLMGFARCAMAEPEPRFNGRAFLGAMLIGALMWAAIIGAGYALVDWLR